MFESANTLLVFSRTVAAEHFSNYFSLKSDFFDCPPHNSSLPPLSHSLSLSLSLSRYITGMHFAFIHLRRSHSHVVKQKICPYNETKRTVEGGKNSFGLFVRPTSFDFFVDDFLFLRRFASRCLRPFRFFRNSFPFLERTFSSPSQNRTKEATQKNSACGHPTPSHPPSFSANRGRDRKTDREEKIYDRHCVCECLYVHVFSYTFIMYTWKKNPGFGNEL